MFNSKCAEVFCQSFDDFAIVCTDCNLKTNVFSEFVLHYQQIHCNPSPVIKCEVPDVTPVGTDNIKCENFQFEDEYEMDENLSDSNDDKSLKDNFQENPLESSQFCCPICGKNYSKKQSLRWHLHRHHPDIELTDSNITTAAADAKTTTCPDCPNKSYSSRKALNRHRREKHATVLELINNYQCPAEDDSVATFIHAENTVERALNKAESSENECKTGELGNKSFQFESDYELNKDEVYDSDDDNDDTLMKSSSKDHPTERTQISCPKCDKKYVNRKSLRMHLRRRHPDVKLPRLNAAPATTTCPDCPDKTYSSRKALHRHRREKHAPEMINNYQCPHCEKQFKTRDGLSAHLRCVHKVLKSGTELKRYPCSQCDRVFSERYNLKRHETRHTGVRNFICPEPDCGKAFYDIKCLGSHRRLVHVGMRKFVCDICGFTTKTSSSLATHIRTHTGERPYKCDQCDKWFTTSAAVIEHKVIHNSHIRPYVCDVCGKSFARPKALYHHKPLHLDIKKFICKICGKAYAQQAGLSVKKKL